MTFYVPLGLIAIAVVLRFTIASNKQRRSFIKERKDSLNDIRQQYLASMISSGKIDKEDTRTDKDE